MALVAAFAVAAVACGSDDATRSGATTEIETSELGARLHQIDTAIAAWRDAATIDEAQVAAETAANLVVGPNGPGYGDRNGDGTVDGSNLDGVLPGRSLLPSGLATDRTDNQCVVDDVLGGSWEEPDARWDTMIDAIAEWSPTHNTMPTLPSHPMRIVGWATFTLATDDLDDAHEYAGHAQLHADVSTAALDC